MEELKLLTTMVQRKSGTRALNCLSILVPHGIIFFPL